VQKLKGKTSYKLLSEFSHLQKVFWGRHLWARGYFCCSSGRITDEMIKAYIDEQSHEDDIDFKVEGEEIRKACGGVWNVGLSTQFARMR
jgi:putative transposase